MVGSFTVSFFGHRRIADSVAVEMRLDKLIRELIDSKPFVEFLVGRNGDFDQLVSSAVRRAKREFRGDNNALVLVLPYVTAEYKLNEDNFLTYYDEIEVCEESASAHYKKAIQIRNCIMVNRSDLVISCIDHKGGGAYKTIQYAKLCQKPVWDLHTIDLNILQRI